jgi:hypothetical protein
VPTVTFPVDLDGDHVAPFQAWQVLRLDAADPRVVQRRDLALHPDAVVGVQDHVKFSVMMSVYAVLVCRIVA